MVTLNLMKHGRISFLNRVGAPVSVLRTVIVLVLRCSFLFIYEDGVLLLFCLTLHFVPCSVLIGDTVW